MPEYQFQTLALEGLRDFYLVPFSCQSLDKNVTQLACLSKEGGTHKDQSCLT